MRLTEPRRFRLGFCVGCHLTRPVLSSAGIRDLCEEMNLEQRTSVAKLGLGLAAFALGQALQNGNGGLTFPATVWLTVALVCAAAGVMAHYRQARLGLQQIVYGVLTLGLVWQIGQLVTVLPGIYLVPMSYANFQRFQAGVLIAGCLAVLSLAPAAWLRPKLRTTLVGLTLVVVFCVGVWVIRASPNPKIDTYVFQQSSGLALLQGQNPYRVTPPNIYGHMEFYGAELVKDGRMTIGNPYPPLSVSLSTLGFIVGGDIRYSHLLAIVLASALIAGLRPGRAARLAAYLVLFTPRVFFIVEQSWTEPFVLLGVVLTVFCALRRPRWTPLALGLLLASKQYMPFLLPVAVLLLPRKATWRDWAWLFGGSVGVAVIVTAPLALWDVPAFLWNVGWAQWYQVFRLDALSYLAIYARAFGQPPSQFISFIALLCALLFCWRYAPRSPEGFASALAFSLGIFFAFNKQAFANYYFLVVGALCGAFAALPPRAADSAARDTPRRFFRQKLKSQPRAEPATIAVQSAPPAR